MVEVVLGIFWVAGDLAELGDVREGDYQGALKELLQADELDPENADIQNALGYTYQSLRLLDKAVIHFKKALELRADFPEAQNNLGTVYLMLKKWDMAAELFGKAAENILYRDRHSAYNNLGMVYHNKGQYRKAIQNYRKAVEIFKGFILLMTIWD